MQFTHPDTAWFTHDRFGMFIHWGLYSLGARHEWLKNKERISDEEYQKYFDHFDPDLYDPKEWAKSAKDAGMKYVVLTTKHHEGFCMWDTKHTDYKATNTPHGKDLLRPFVDAFREAGLKVGFYYSLLDWHHPDYTLDTHHPLALRHNLDSDFITKENEKRDIRRYAQYMRNQVEELLTQFGRIDLLWFDFSFPHEKFPKGHNDWESEKLYALIRKLQPHILLDNRLDLEGTGDFVTPEQHQPFNCKHDVWEACQTLSGSWGYHRDEQTWKTTNQLLWMLIDGASQGGNLLLNVGPTPRGEFDSRAKDRLAGIAKWMKYHSRSIYGCGRAPADLPTPRDCRYTYNPKTNRLYLHILQWPFERILVEKIADKIDYVQFLHDASEVLLNVPDPVHSATSIDQFEKGSVILKLPVVKPDVEIPVIEIFLKK